MKPSERKKARQYALQAIYQWIYTQADASVIEQQFFNKHSFSKTDRDYFKTLLYGVVHHQQTLDEYFSPYSERTIDELGPIELAILRLSTYELAHQLDVPYKVVINEGIELGKRFAAEESYKYINSVLDKTAKKLRVQEIIH
ncbi:MAG: transcription antitermination factor NusB [Gammaproteobacteria bacterium]|nr:transcription antitermination factor NusB [Gammaproteobacteria bacterium]